MSYKKEDFKELEYNVFGVKDILKTFPVLKKYKEFTENVDGIDKDSILKYIIFFYDKNSRLHLDMEDVLKRKMIAADLSGFKQKKNGGYKKDVEAILNCLNPITNSMILRYVRIQNNHKWAKFTVFQDTYYSQLRELQKAIEGEDDKNKKDNISAILSNIKNIENEMDKIAGEVLNDDNNKNLIESLYSKIDIEPLKLRPEDFAENENTED